MRTLNVCVNCIPKKIPIGHVGENVVEAIQFDYSAWKTTYGEGTLNMVLQRSPDAIPYAVEMTDGLYIVTSTDLEYQGAVRAQLVYNVTGNPVPVKKSDVFLLGVEVSLGDAGDIPDPWQSWLDRVLQASDQAQEAVEHYPKVENGYWYVWNVSTESWTNTGQKAQGEEGAPGVGVDSTVLNADYTLTITLTDGTSYTTPPIRGATGNGIDSTVLNADYTLTITFTDGTSYTTPSIRGAQGIPGQNYVITSADYDEIAGRVDTMIAGERQAALDDIDDAKDDAIADVAAEGTTQVGLVTDEGTTQKDLVTSEGTTQVGLVTAKGQEVIQSIPSDYSELSDDVSELKSDFTNLSVIGGNLLTFYQPEAKIMSTLHGTVVFYDNTSYSTFFVPVSSGNTLYIADKRTSGYSPIRYAPLASDKTGSANDYVSTNVYPDNPITFVASADGYYAISIDNTNVQNVSVSKTLGDTDDYYEKLNENFILNNRQKEEVESITDAEVESCFASALNGKKLFALGDSITYGYTVTGKDSGGEWIGGRVTKKWYEYVADRYGVTAVANAEIGRSFTKNGSMSTRFTVAEENITIDSDIIVVFGGTNDFNWSPLIGTFDDTPSNADGGITFYAALKYVAEYLSTNYADKTIIFFTPLPRNNTEGFAGKDANNDRVSDFADAIREVCRQYGFLCVDLNKVFGYHVFSQDWLADYMPDGLHPNDAGTELYVQNGIFPVFDTFFRPLDIGD